MASNNDPKVIRDLLVQALVTSNLTQTDKLIAISEVLEVYNQKLQEEETEKGGSWRKYPDERPNQEDYFLVVVENAITFPNVTYGYYSKKEDKFKCVEEWDVLPVTHWQPLPEPPKEN